jgi:2-iminobutanoate/2-iminopropanoate deaminase
MKKEIKNNSKAYKAIGHYLPVIKIGNLIFVSGKIPIEPTIGEIVEGDNETQTKKN